MEKHKRIHRIKNRIIDMPREVYTKEPKIITVGFNELIIENYKSILKYEEEYIRLETEIGNLNINGTDLNLIQMKEDHIKITGKIISMDLERK